MNRAKLRTTLFDFQQLILLLFVGDRLFADIPGITFFLQGGVIEFVIMGKPSFKSGLLSVAWIDSVLEGFQHQFFSLTFHLSLDDFQKRITYDDDEVRQTSQMIFPSDKGYASASPENSRKAGKELQSFSGLRLMSQERCLLFACLSTL